MAKKKSIKGLYKRVLIKPFYIKLAAFEKAAVLYIKSKRKEKRKDLFFPLWLDYLSLRPRALVYLLMIKIIP